MPRERVDVAQQALSIIKRPEPPLELTAEERYEWVSVINSLPADWLEAGMEMLLVQYCRHKVRARRISGLIINAERDPEGANPFLLSGLYDQEMKQTRTLMMLTIRMGFGKSMDRRGNGSKPKPDKPWEDGEWSESDDIDSNPNGDAIDG